MKCRVNAVNPLVYSKATSGRHQSCNVLHSDTPQRCPLPPQDAKGITHSGALGRVMRVMTRAGNRVPVLLKWIPVERFHWNRTAQMLSLETAQCSLHTSQECGVLGRFCASAANGAATAASSSTGLSFDSGSLRVKKCGGRPDDGRRTTIHNDVFLFSAGHCWP